MERAAMSEKIPWWKLKPFYFFHSAGFVDQGKAIIGGTVLIIPILRHALVLVQTPWSKFPYLRVVNWEGKLEIPAPPRGWRRQLARPKTRGA
jgi:hypothetical protein